MWRYLNLVFLKLAPPFGRIWSIVCDEDPDVTVELLSTRRYSRAYDISQILCSVTVSRCIHDVCEIYIAIRCCWQRHKPHVLCACYTSQPTLDTVLPSSCSLQSSIIVAWTLSNNLPPISKRLGGQYPVLSIAIRLQFNVVIHPQCCEPRN